MAAEPAASVHDLAKTARALAAAPDYDEQAIRDALWAVVDAVLATRYVRDEPLLRGVMETIAESYPEVPYEEGETTPTGKPTNRAVARAALKLSELIPL